MPQSPSHRRSSQRAALPLKGWDIALQLDEDLRLGNNLIECLEYSDGVRLFAVVDVALPGLAGAALAARVRGIICSQGILSSDPIPLLNAVHHELADRPDLGSPVGMLLASVSPGGSDVKLVVHNHPGALVLRNAPEPMPATDPSDDASTTAVGAVSERAVMNRVGAAARATRAFVTEGVVTDAAALTTLTLHPREAVLLISRFACDVGDSVSVREARHAELARKAQEVVAAGSSTAIDGIVRLGASVRESAGADWPNRLLSMVWIRRAAIVV